VFLRPAGYNTGTNPPGRELGTNGLTFDAQGRLVVADHGNRGISRWNDSLFTRTVVVDRFEGKRLNSPNDLVWGPNGDMYFTDPSYGLRRLNEDPAKELPFNGVFRLSAGGQLSTVTRDLTFPNGIGLSPDARTLYVAISDGRNPYIMAYAVNADGSTGQGRVFYDARARVQQGLKGGLDGLKIDAKGNIFATGPGGILVLSPEGKHLGTIYPGDVVANCAFGDDGSTLYMTVNHQLMRVRTQTKGLGF
jgi:gluconolactonase